MCEMCVGWSRCRVSKPGQAPPPPGGPAGAWRPRGLACRHSNFACNSPAACSNIEFASLELQRFLRLLKFGPIELHAKFVWRWSCQPMLALPTGSLHRGLALRFLRTLRRPPDRWGLVCCCVGSLDFCLVFGTKLSLLGFLVVKAVQNSPCMRRLRQIGPFRVCWESFVPEVGPCDSCWESFVPERR